MNEPEVYWFTSRGHRLPTIEDGPQEPSPHEMEAMSEREWHLWSLAAALASYHPCALCRRFPVESKTEGLDGVHDLHDACIVDLPGVDFACCGHGQVNSYDEDECYIAFSDGLRLYGNAARAAMEMLGGDPPAPPLTVDRAQTYGEYGVSWKPEDA